MEERDDQILIVNTQTQVILPESGSETKLGIRRTDWQRIRTHVSQVEKPLPKLEVIYAALFGVAATSGLSIPIVLTQNNPSPWVLSFYIDVFTISLLIAIALIAIGEWAHKFRKDEVEIISREMKSIEDQYPSPPPEALPQNPRPKD